MSCRLFRRPVGVDGAHGLGGVGAALRLLALLVGLVDGDGVPGGSVGHALLLGGDLALLGGVGLGESGLGGRALRGSVSVLRGLRFEMNEETKRLTDSVLPSSE